jgi:hypothetical protein
MLADSLHSTVLSSQQTGQPVSNNANAGQLLTKKVLKEISIASVKFMNSGWAEQVGFITN